jgi:hypothetical protein
MTNPVNPPPLKLPTTPNTELNGFLKQLKDTVYLLWYNTSGGGYPPELLEAIAFFAATNITGAEAETLTDGSDAQSLHTHEFYARYTLVMS